MPRTRKTSTDVEPIEGEIVENGNGREAPKDLAIVRFQDVLQATVTPEQFRLLRGEIPPHAIFTREGPGGRPLKYLRHGWVRDTLTKCFGADWDYEVLSDFGGQPYVMQDREELVGRAREKVTTHHLTVHGQLTVRVRNPRDITQILAVIVKSDFGSAVWRDGIEFGDALKSASSDALKRCGLGLGIGASLYYNDDAALAQYNKTQATAQAVAEAVANPEVPTSLPMFIARAMQEFSMDAAKLQDILGLSINDMAAKFPDGAEDLWRTLSEKMTEVKPK